jgi:orotate phosphoribosyltransferase
MKTHDRQALARRIFEASNIKGQFRLRSGAISDEYFDKYLFESNPDLLREIAEAMSALVPPGVDVLAGLEMGGIPLVTVLSQVTGIPAVFVRKAPKAYGTCKLVEGGEVAGREVVVVEDVATTGGQIIESAKALGELGAHIAGVFTVIDREAGGAAKLAAAGLVLHSLFTMTELKDASRRK